MSTAPPTEEKPKEKFVVPIEHRLSLTLDECAALTGLKVCYFRNAIHAGELAYLRSGETGQYIIRRDTLEKFLRTQEQREVAR